MSVPMLTPVETPIFDDLVLEQMGEHWDDEVGCEAPKGCERPAVARFVALCECRASRVGCAEHIAETMRWFDVGRRRCSRCGTLATGYRVVTL